MKCSYTEEDVMHALEAIANGASIRRASLDYGIPRSTLHNRIYGHTSHQEAAASLQKLSPIQEKRLIEWVLIQEALGLCPTHAQIKDFAQRILALRGDLSKLGKRWIQGFLKRNPILRTKKQFKIDSVRVNGATTDIIRTWFQKLEIPQIRAIKASNRWNMDEAGIMEGQGLNGLVVGSANRRFIQKKQPGSRVWTSFIEYIFATGVALPPLVIFKGKSVQQQWFPIGLDKFKPWKFTATENGWTSNDTAIEWLEKVFIPCTTLEDPREARLLIFDGHKSHETTEFIYKCFEHNIYLLFLPSHTSHVLQPLDLLIFSPLKSAYRTALNNLNHLIDSIPIGKRNFIECYYKARETSLTYQNIRAGWLATGLWPKNKSKPLMNRLLLENSNNSVQPTSQDSIKEAKILWDLDTSLIEWETPRVAKDLHAQTTTLIQLGETDLPTRRLLFRKIVKGFNEKDFDLAQANLQIDQLKARLEQLQPRRRQKVLTSPNSKFVDIQAIRQAQIQAGDREIDNEDSDASIESASTGDCIIVQPS